MSAGRPHCATCPLAIGCPDKCQRETVEVQELADENGQQGLDLCNPASPYYEPPRSDDMPERGNTQCNRHPDAPHGFNRNASHNAGHYVCDCGGWMPPNSSVRTCPNCGSTDGSHHISCAYWRPTDGVGVTLNADETKFLATRLRRLFTHFKVAVPDDGDDARLIGSAGSAISTILDAERRRDTSGVKGGGDADA